MVGIEEIVMRKFLVAALMAGVASSAFAADLPSRKAPPAPVYAAPPVFTWTGFYVGVNGGYGFGDFRGGGNTTFGNPNGGLVGGTAGYNYQINSLVLGVEGDLDWADLSKSKTLPSKAVTTAKVDALGHVLGRVGFTPFDRTLLYVAGGYAGGQVKGTLDAPTAAGAHFSNSAWQSGYALGAGVEYAVTQNVSVKAQYLFSQLGDQTYFAGKSAVKTGLNVNAITAGINYRF
jgi:outer membrane immunogenic protein